MEVKNKAMHGGSLKISSDVIEKIAKMATMEIEGVADISVGNTASTNGFIGKLTAAKPISVEVSDGVADIEISIIVDFGVKIPDISKKIQKNVKSSVQNMTSITVASVMVIVAGVSMSDNVISEGE